MCSAPKMCWWAYVASCLNTLQKDWESTKLFLKVLVCFNLILLPLSVSRQGTILVTACFMFRFWMLWHDPNGIPTSLANSQGVRNLFSWTESPVISIFSSAMLVDKPPKYLAFSIEVIPIFNFKNHWNLWFLFLVFLIKENFNMLQAFIAVSPRLKQNLNFSCSFKLTLHETKITDSTTHGLTSWCVTSEWHILWSWN